MSKKEEMKPTSEQVECVGTFLSGVRQRINAYAGTGKTSTLELMANTVQKPGVYLAFNKAIATEAKSKFPTHIKCSTVHSMAFAPIAKKGFHADKMTAGFNGRVLTQSPDIMIMPQVNPFITLRESTVAHLVAETIKRWCRGASKSISIYHVPRDGKLAGCDENVKEFRQVLDYIVERANFAWKMMSNPRHSMPLGFDGYLKLWALTEPRIYADFVMLDEAQDTNGVVLDIIQKQQSQVISVGDRYQAIYSWRGAKNAMDDLPCDVENRITKSFRFGPNISAYASRVLATLGEDIPLIGNENRADKIIFGRSSEQPNAYLFRTNAGLLSQLMDSLESGEKPHIIGGTNEMKSMINATRRLQSGSPVDVPVDFLGFANWDEVRDFSQTAEGQELSRWVKTVDQYGVDRLERAIEGLPKDEKKAPYVLSTGHKSKGRQWPVVSLDDGFLRGIRASEKDKDLPLPKDGGAEEQRLFYVAITRAQNVVEIPEILHRKVERLEGMGKKAAE